MALCSHIQFKQRFFIKAQSQSKHNVQIRSASKFTGAQDGIRTRDLVLTKDVLYRLSYLGSLERETGFEPATLSLEG